MLFATPLRLEKWIEGRPPWARTPLYGALVVFTLMGAKLLAGAAVFLALGIALSDTPLRLVLLAIGVTVAALIGGALSGAMYDLVGRALVRRRGILADVGSAITLLPYMLVLSGLIALGDTTARDLPLLLASAGICAILFGSLALKGFLLDILDAQEAARPKQTKARGR